jgi:amino acid permease
MLQGLGDIAFAFPYTSLVLEIQDTLKSTPPENVTMKKANLLSLSVTTTFYMLCAFLGYAAFGENAPGNLLTGFGFYEPYWLIDFANACIVVHLVAAYQVFCQPIFACVEGWFSHIWPDNKFINKGVPIRIPLCGSCRVNLLRLCWRTAFVVSTTGIAILFPLFNDVLGILGALNFWPLVVYFPVEMYIAQNKVPRWKLKWSIFQIFSFISLLVTVITAAGSIEGLVKDKET